MPLLIQDLVQERYRLQTRLGSNGPRQTWQALDQRSGQIITLKALFFGEGMAWQDLKLAERSAQTLATLKHPQIPQFIEAFWLIQPEGSYYCLVQTFIPGSSLAECVAQGQRFSEAEVRSIAEVILGILMYLHDQAPPVIHRDIKPSNLIVNAERRIYLIDFGAVQADPNTGATITVVGTYGYMPPEQFGGQTVPASDLYALGATLLFLLTGINPINLPKKNLWLQVPDEAHVSDGFKAWLAYLLDPNCDQRFSSARVALQALQTNLLPRSSDISAFPAISAIKPDKTAIKLEKGSDQLMIKIPSGGMAIKDFLRALSIFPAVGGGFITLVTLVYVLPSIMFYSSRNTGDAIMYFTNISALTIVSLILFLIAWKALSSLFYETSTVLIDLSKEDTKIIWTSLGLRHMRTKEFLSSDIQGIEFTNSQSNHKNTGDICFLVRDKNSCKEIRLRANLTSQERAWVVYELRSWLRAP